ncbi:MAG: DNA polymerase III subunit gamma/tau [Bacteroidales bacterium]|nr:DNA polymerase III subunit gamma/tau [Candidatus Liminaster caballi]
MSDYIVSARKYRPQSFKTVVGQKALVQTLKNAVTSGKLAHAYLFCGPRGVGKTTCARIFAKTINCQHPTPDGEACCECESCNAFDEQRSYNVYELDAASNNGVDQIRDLIEQVQVAPQIGKYKVFIIDEVHMLSTAAFNAFLKTLEEPPRHAIFVMCTTEKQKILPTILSRCQTYDFQRITVQDIVDQLTRIANEEGVMAEAQALQVIARKADGGMRDALSIFDQIVSFTDGKVTYQATIDNLNILDYELFFRLTDAALAGNIPAAVKMLDDVIRRGFDAQSFIGGWASHLRDLMVAQDPATLSLIEAGPEVAQQYQRQAAGCHPAFLYQGLQIASDCDFNYRNSRNKRLLVELAIVKICQIMHPIQVPASQQQVAPQPTQQPVRPAQTQTQAQAYQQPVRQPSPQPVPQQTPQPTPQPAPQQAMRPQPQAQFQQPLSQPAPQPLPQAQPQTVGLPSGANRFAARAGGPRIASLNGVQQQQQTTTSATQTAIQEMNEPVTPDALRRSWKQFISTYTTEQLLTKLMTGCLPQQVEGTQYKVTVLSNAQFEIIEPQKERITRYLCEQLHNSHIKLSVEVTSEDDGIKIPFSPREKIQDMISKNPSINSLIETFELEIG